MDFYSPIVRHLVAPLWALRERSPYLKYLKYLEESQFRPLEEVRSDQLRRLRQLVFHAFQNTDYYSARMRQHGLNPSDLQTWDDLSRLPLLTKDEVRANKEAMVARNFPRPGLVPKSTSGSTGLPIELFWSEDSRQWKRACAIRHDRWTGWDIGDRMAALWGNPEHKKNWRAYARNLLLERCDYLDTLDMTEEDMLHFFKRLKRTRPALIFGHAHSLYLFASFLRAKRLSGVKPRAVISTAMVLHGFERALIEHVFACKVTDRYGCEEVSLIASECEEHRGLHINMDTLIVEFLKDDKPVPPGEPGGIVVTDLTNYAMPFIRYKLGDVAVPAGRACRCGRTYPLVESIEGRSSDFIVTPEGRFVSGISLTENFILKLRDTKQTQIVQDKPNHITLKVVRDAGFGEASRSHMEELVRKVFGPSMTYSLEFLEALPQESSAKFRFCTSIVQNPFL